MVRADERVSWFFFFSLGGGIHDTTVGGPAGGGKEEEGRREGSGGKRRYQIAGETATIGGETGEMSSISGLGVASHVSSCTHPLHAFVLLAPRGSGFVHETGRLPS